MDTFIKIQDELVQFYEKQFSKTFVRKLNNVIQEAIYHGGDAGGPYDSSEHSLNEAINKLLVFLKLDKMYEVVFDDDVFCGIVEKNLYDKIHAEVCKLKRTEKEKEKLFITLDEFEIRALSAIRGKLFEEDDDNHISTVFGLPIKKIKNEDL